MVNPRGLGAAPEPGDIIAAVMARWGLTMAETILDVKQMKCPLPVLRANRALRALADGETLRVLATDRASVNDFKIFCRETGHALLATGEQDGVFSFLIRKQSRPTPEAAS